MRGSVPLEEDCAPVPLAWLLDELLPDDPFDVVLVPWLLDDGDDAVEPEVAPLEDCPLEDCPLPDEL